MLSSFFLAHSQTPQALRTLIRIWVEKYGSATTAL